MSAGRTPVILDVDTGIDDALALGLAVCSPEIELVAVTTLAGNADVTRTTANTLAVLDWLGASKVPVHRGASRPLTRQHRDAASVHGTHGLGTAALPQSDREVGRDRGPAAIIRLAGERPGEMTLVCVGPLTNLAIALNVEPALPRLLRRVVVMGGAYRVPGNVTPHAEFNIYVDPEAAAQVFATEFADLIVIGLDVTHQTALTRQTWERAAERADRRSRLVVEVCRWSLLDRGQSAVYLHDPLALAVALDSALVTPERGNVEVVLEGEERGKTRVVAGDLARIAVAVDVERFLGLFEARLGLASDR